MPQFLVLTEGDIYPDTGGGGGVRVGLEDNIYFDAERTRLATNLELVKRIKIIGEAFGLIPYTIAEARTILKVG